MKTILVLFLFFFSVLAHAGVSVAPVHLNVLHTARSTSLQIQNDTDEASSLYVRVMKWQGQREDGSDILEQTDAIVLSRPMIAVAARTSTTIRIIVKSRSSDAEDAYRVMVNDITPALPDGKVPLRINSVLPLFVLNTADSRGQLELKEGVLVNSGNRHVRISRYTNKQGASINLLRYVMPGQSIALPVSSAAAVTFSDDIY